MSSINSKKEMTPKSDPKIPKSGPSVQRYRQQIDALDRDILRLLSKRAEYAIEIGKIKKGLSQTVYNPKREKQVLDRMVSDNEKNDNVLSPSSVKAVFSEIISSCRSLEHNPKIAYLGPDGSFSHLAALRQFGSSVDFLPQSSINTTFQLLSRGHCDYAVLPIENSIEGMVNNTVDQLSVNQLYIHAELFLPIHLCLFVPKESSGLFKKGRASSPALDALDSEADKKNVLSKIKVLYSHPQPFGQARNWIEKNLPKVELRESHSTSHAAEECLKVKNSACIGSEHLLKVFSLQLVEEKIEDVMNNTTRFVVVASKLRIPEGKDNITSLIITIKDKPGALYNILSVFARSKINLTNLVSRPSRRKAFDYFFYIDFEGNIDEPRVAKVLKKITPFVVEVKIIGAYPRGIFF